MNTDCVADYTQSKKQYYFLEQQERTLRKKLRHAGREGDKQRADMLWEKTRLIVEQRKDTEYYKFAILPSREQKNNKNADCYPYAKTQSR